jgi:hypothetical protein
MAPATVTKEFPPQSVEWEGTLYGPGETIPDLPAEEIARLKALGRIEIPGKQAEKNPDPGGKKEKPEPGKKKKEPDPDPDK